MLSSQLIDLTGNDASGDFDSSKKLQEELLVFIKEQEWSKPNDYNSKINNQWRKFCKENNYAIEIDLNVYLKDKLKFEDYQINSIRTNASITKKVLILYYDELNIYDKTSITKLAMSRGGCSNLIALATYSKFLIQDQGFAKQDIYSLAIGEKSAVRLQLVQLASPWLKAKGFSNKDIIELLSTPSLEMPLRGLLENYDKFIKLKIHKSIIIQYCIDTTKTIRKAENTDEENRLISSPISQPMELKKNGGEDGSFIFPAAPALSSQSHYFSPQVTYSGTILLSDGKFEPPPKF